MYRSYLSEHEVRGFIRPKPTANWFNQIALPLASFIVAATLVWGGTNLSALQRANTAGFPASVVLADAGTPAPTLPAVVSTPTPSPTPELPTIPAESISYSAVGVSAPVRWNTPIDEKTVLTQLQEGVVHIKNTALPGQQGTTVIFGHSSSLPWLPGNFKDIFAPLHSSEVGDTIDLNLNNKMYHYRVTSKFEVKSTEVSMLNAKPGVNLRLITCTPIGTALRRLVVEAELITPDSSTLTAFEQTAFSNQLPGD